MKVREKRISDYSHKTKSFCNIRKCVGMLMMLFTMLFMSKISVWAAEGSVTYGSGSYTATQGESFQVGVYVQGSEAIGSYEFYLDYNPDMMEYVSGADSGGAGRLKFVGYGNSTSYSYMLTFRATTAGNCTISISGADLGPLDPSSGDSMTITQASSAPVTIQGPSTASDDCRLSSLNLSPTGLYGFSPDVTEYDITVEHELTKLSVSATTSSEKATYVISDTNLNVGVNTIKITVTAENGATKTYSIIVRRKAEEVTTTQATQATTLPPEAGYTPEEIDLSVSFPANGKDMFVSEAPSGVSVPNGFTETTIAYQDKEITAYSGGIQNVTLFYMVDGLKSNGGFYVYDAAKNSVYPYIKLDNAQGSYLLLSADDTISSPEGYTATTVTLAGDNSESVQTNVTAWVSDRNAEFFLVYAMNTEGETAFYQYDTKEKTLQRYHGGMTLASSDTKENETTVPDDVEELREALAASRQENQESAKMHFLIIIVLAILSIILIFVIVGLVLKIRGIIGAEEKIYEEEAAEDLTVQEVNKSIQKEERKKIEKAQKAEKTEKAQPTKKVQKTQKTEQKKTAKTESFEETEFDLDDDFEFFDYDEEDDGE